MKLVRTKASPSHRFPRVRDYASLKHNYEDYLVTLIFIIGSGHVFFTEGGNNEVALLGAAGGFTFLLLCRRRLYFSPRFILASGIFGALFAIQATAFNFFPPITVIGFMLRIYVAYTAILLVSELPAMFVVVMTHLCLLSFLFYIPDQISELVGFDYRGKLGILNQLFGSGLAHRYDIGFHNFMKRDSYRNAGLFWEPGAFTGFISLALLFLGLIRNQIENKAFQRALIILVLALLSTFSTTGYVALPLVMTAVFSKNIKDLGTNRMAALAVLACILPLLVVAKSTYNLSFMNKKISRELKAVKTPPTSGYYNRLSSIHFHKDYIKQRPLTGWGRNFKTYLDLHPYIQQNPADGNGMLRFVHEMGLIGFMAFLIPTFAAFYHLAQGEILRSVIIWLVILLLIQGEDYLTHPVFLGLMFLDEGAGPRVKAPAGPINDPLLFA